MIYNILTHPSCFCIALFVDLFIVFMTVVSKKVQAIVSVSHFLVLSYLFIIGVNRSMYYASDSFVLDFGWFMTFIHWPMLASLFSSQACGSLTSIPAISLKTSSRLYFNARDR